MPDALSVPTVKLDLSPSREVRFTFGTLCRIEQRTGKPPVALLQSLAPETRDQTESWSKSLSVVAMGAFVAACLDVPGEKLDELVPPASFMAVYTQLIGGYSRAVSQLLGVQDETESAAANPPAPSGSGSGPASSSV